MRTEVWLRGVLWVELKGGGMLRGVRRRGGEGVGNEEGEGGD